MGTSINTTGGGGIHPGAPIIWPTSKNKIQETKSVEEAQQSTTKVSSESATSATSTTQAPAQQATQQAKPLSPATPSARPMSMADVVDQLVQIGIPNTPENKEMASMMMQYGLELSADNFELLQKLIRGDKRKTTTEAGIVSLAKGLGSSTKSVDILASFLATNSQIAKQMENVRQALTNMQQAISSGRDVLGSGLMSNLGALLMDMDSEFSKLVKKSGDKTGLSMIDRGGLIKDMKALMQFLAGLEQKLASEGKLNTPEGKMLQAKMHELKKHMPDLMDNLISQAILSKDSNRQISHMSDKYLYWQFPNPLAENQSHIDLVIRKDPKKIKGEIDPEKTRMIIKFETPKLGEVTVIIDILESKIWYIFNTESDETSKIIRKTQGDLMKRMQALNYQIYGLQTLKKKVEIKKFILPTINLDNMVRIRTEV